MVPIGSACTERPKCFCTAAWVKVPSGPRKPTFKGCCSARQADMISRNSRAISSSESGPRLREMILLSTWASRSGR